MIIRMLSMALCLLTSSLSMGADADLKSISVVVAKYAKAMAEHDAATVVQCLDPVFLEAFKNSLLVDMDKGGKNVAETAKILGYSDAQGLIGADASEIYTRLANTVPRSQLETTSSNSLRVKVGRIELQGNDKAIAKIQIVAESPIDLKQEAEVALRRTTTGWKVSPNASGKIGFVQD
jgi:hypothetical protein